MVMIISQSMLVTGVSLAKLIRQRRGKGDALNVTECYPRITQLHEAIAELYADKAHGLLKPENVLLLADGIRVTDYGLAQGLPREALVEAQREAGTLAYLAPEVRNGAPPVSADVYGLGAIFAKWCLITRGDQLAGDERFAAYAGDYECGASCLCESYSRRSKSAVSDRSSVRAALAEISRELCTPQGNAFGSTTVPVLLTVQDMPAVKVDASPTTQKSLIG